MEESRARGRPTFARAKWLGKCLAGSQCLMSWKGVTQSVLAQLDSYLVHCIVYGGPLILALNYSKRREAQLFMDLPDCARPVDWPLL